MPKLLGKRQIKFKKGRGEKQTNRFFYSKLVFSFKLAHMSKTRWEGKTQLLALCFLLPELRTAKSAEQQSRCSAGIPALGYCTEQEALLHVPQRFTCFQCKTNSLSQLPCNYFVCRWNEAECTVPPKYTDGELDKPIKYCLFISILSHFWQIETFSKNYFKSHRKVGGQISVIQYCKWTSIHGVSLHL